MRRQRVKRQLLLVSVDHDDDDDDQLQSLLQLSPITSKCHYSHRHAREDTDRRVRLHQTQYMASNGGTARQRMRMIREYFLDFARIKEHDWLFFIVQMRTLNVTHAVGCPTDQILAVKNNRSPSMAIV